MGRWIGSDHPPATVVSLGDDAEALCNFIGLDNATVKCTGHMPSVVMAVSA